MPERATPDIVAKHLDALLVGMNPGLVSAAVGHNFANPGNGFWRLLHESGLLPKRLKPEEESLLLEHGLGLTNLVGRPTAGVMDLNKEDYERGRKELAHTIETLKPRAVVFVGVMVYREFLGNAKKKNLSCGEMAETIAGARVFVVPNPSGRNAHFSYAEMLAHFRGVAQALGR